MGKLDISSLKKQSIKNENDKQIDWQKKVIREEMPKNETKY